MSAKGLRAVVALCVCVALARGDGNPLERMDRSIPAPAPSGVSADSRSLPLRFEANAGQWSADVRYVAHAGGTTVALTDEGATLALRSPRAFGDDAAPATPTLLEMKVAGGRAVTPIGDDELVTKSNYLIGNDRSAWRTDVPNFGRATYRGVRDGVDLVYHGDGNRLEYDFVVAPGTNPDEVALDVEGAESLSLSPSGDLIIHTLGGDLQEPPPRVYQTLDDGGQKVVSGKYRLRGTRVAFDVGPYDKERALVIDPIVALYSTYLGGSDLDKGAAVALDGSGSAYITGCASSTNFPMKNPLQGAWAGGSCDVFVAS